MSVNIRYPNITGLSDKEQITQIKSYLHQLVEQLNYELTTLGSVDGSAPTTEVQGEEISYYELRSLIVQQLQEVKSLFEQLEDKMEDGYVKEEELPEAINTALEQAKESGEFDGKDGVGIASTSVTDDGLIINYSDGSTTNLGKLSFTMDEKGDLYYEIIQDGNISNETEE